ncbi:hypothetical protein MC7420_4463 [Coleofasciculus chthonoplastes PCC 7420]|uniref:Uncharacterized protein n=1 Tax=Coleofasciculus chthonoplastes PCC 7420 TaxID=118168 RepID=B4VXS9_9CYAN|nr:hypothetical protein MC7420_4463 [Coleofasciculus chthonoplastes PCC 7420]
MEFLFDMISFFYKSTRSVGQGHTSVIGVNSTVNWVAF